MKHGGFFAWRLFRVSVVDDTWNSAFAASSAEWRSIATCLSRNLKYRSFEVWSWRGWRKSSEKKCWMPADAHSCCLFGRKCFKEGVAETRPAHKDDNIVGRGLSVDKRRTKVIRLSNSSCFQAFVGDRWDVNSYNPSAADYLVQRFKS